MVVAIIFRDAINTRYRKICIAFNFKIMYSCKKIKMIEVRNVEGFFSPFQGPEINTIDNLVCLFRHFAMLLKHKQDAVQWTTLCWMLNIIFSLKVHHAHYFFIRLQKFTSCLKTIAYYSRACDFYYSIAWRFLSWLKF